MLHYKILTVPVVLALFNGLSLAHTIVKRAATVNVQSIIESDRYPGRVTDYVVNLPRYQDRYQEKEINGATQESLTKLQDKIDMLERASSEEFLAYAETQRQRACLIEQKYWQIDVELRKAKLQEQAFRLLGRLLLDRESNDVPDAEVYAKYGKQLSTLSSSSRGKVSNLANRFSNMMSGKKGKNAKDKIASVSGRGAANDTEFVRFMQYKAACITEMDPSYFDVIASREEARASFNAGSSQPIQSINGSVYQAELMEKAVLHHDVEAAELLAEEYSKAIDRHAVEKDRLLRWYYYILRKAQVWEATAPQCSF